MKKFYVNLKAIVRLHIDLFGFFLNKSIGRGIYALLLLLYFTKPFHPLINSTISFILAYLIVTGLLLLISVRLPKTREKMFQIFGQEYLYERLGNPASHLWNLWRATAGSLVLGELVVRGGLSIGV